MVPITTARAFALAFGCLTLWTSLGSPDAQAAPIQRIRPGDKLQVTVYNHPELSQTVVVSASDTVSLPLARSVSTQNADAHILATRIAQQLNPFIPYVGVDVAVIAANPMIFLTGGPVGVLPYTPGETLTQAIAQMQSPPAQDASNGAAAPAPAANGVTRNARIDYHRVSIVRDGNNLGPFDVLSFGENGQTGPELNPGDNIVLRDKAVKVRVVGNIVSPGFAYLDRDEPLSDAITQCGGPTADGAAFVLLTRDGHIGSYPLGSPTLAMAGSPGDILTVPRAPHIGVVGAVEKPGDVTLHGDGSLLSAIYNAGGPSRNANLSSVAVVHNGVRTEYNVISAIHGGDGTVMLADGDTVFVPVGHKVDFSAFWQAVGALGSVIYAVK